MLRDIAFYLQRIPKFFKESFIFFRNFIHDNWKQNGKEHEIRIACNGYSVGPQKDWFLIFIKALTGRSSFVSWYKPSLLICSSFGSYWLLKILLYIYSIPSLFFSEENLATLKKYREYKNYLDGRLSLAMGFDYYEGQKYRRFPLWLMYLFTPENAVHASVTDIQNQLDEIEAQSVMPKKKFAAMIASHDGYANPKKVSGSVKMMSRTAITKEVGRINAVHCPGKLLHNDDSLHEKYNNDKKAYLKQFLFTICAENASVKGYVTEKLFDAIEAGTIPIYWGDTNPEPTILNPKRIIFWENTQKKQIISCISKIYTSPSAREQFFKEPIFLDTAAQEIHNHFSLLKNDLKELLDNFG